MTAGEISLARSMFGSAIDYAKVTLRRRKWFPLQPRNVTMAPSGHLYFHPRSSAYCDDFAARTLDGKAFFIHEMTHVWQSQTRGTYFLLSRRMPWARYSYSIVPGQPLDRYGIEQQAEIVRHAFLLRNGVRICGIADASAYDLLVRF